MTSQEYGYKDREEEVQEVDQSEYETGGMVHLVGTNDGMERRGDEVQEGDQPEYDDQLVEEGMMLVGTNDGMERRGDEVQVGDQPGHNDQLVEGDEFHKGNQLNKNYDVENIRVDGNNSGN